MLVTVSPSVVFEAPSPAWNGLEPVDALRAEAAQPTVVPAVIAPSSEVETCRRPMTIGHARVPVGVHVGGELGEPALEGFLQWVPYEPERI
jgi:hypothetical protein